MQWNEAAGLLMAFPADAILQNRWIAIMSWINFSI